jgi:hypothetical protein
MKIYDNTAERSSLLMLRTSGRKPLPPSSLRKAADNTEKIARNADGGSVRTVNFAFDASAAILAICVLT